ncbi:hypothetical protein ABH995_000983 [Bradyrhizobium yuanmingense]
MMVSHAVNYISQYSNGPSEKTLCESARPKREHVVQKLRIDS